MDGEDGILSIDLR